MTFWPTNAMAEVAPYHGMPKGHLPVGAISPSRSSRDRVRFSAVCSSGTRSPGYFTDRAERIVTALAAQAAVAIDNARLHQTSQREIAARTRAEEELQQLNQTLEERAEERAQQLASSLTELEDTERRFRLLVEGVTDYAIYMLDAERAHHQLESRRRAAKGLHAGGNYRAPLLCLLYRMRINAAGIPKTALAAATETGQFEAEGWRVRKDGTRFWASVVINRITDPHGQLAGISPRSRAISPNGALPTSARVKRRRWKASVKSPAALRTISTTC